MVLCHLILTTATLASFIPISRCCSCFFPNHVDSKIILLHINEQFTGICTCDYNSSTTMKPYWSLNNNSFRPSTKVQESWQVSTDRRYLAGRIEIVVDQTDSGTLCCTMRSCNLACLVLQVEAKFSPRVDINISISHSYKGNSTWNLDVNCTLTTDSQEYRERAIFVLHTKELKEDKKEKISNDCIDTEDHHSHWKRRYFFFYGLQVTKMTNVTCLLLPSGQEENSVSSQTVFDPDAQQENPEAHATSLSATYTSVPGIQPQETTNSIETANGTTNNKSDSINNKILNHAKVAAIVAVPLIVIAAVILIFVWKRYDWCCNVGNRRMQDERRNSNQRSNLALDALNESDLKVVKSKEEAVNPAMSVLGHQCQELDHPLDMSSETRVLTTPQDSDSITANDETARSTSSSDDVCNEDEPSVYDPDSNTSSSSLETAVVEASNNGKTQNKKFSGAEMAMFKMLQKQLDGRMDEFEGTQEDILTKVHAIMNKEHQGQHNLPYEDDSSC